VRLVNTPENVIHIDGLASGTMYQIHVESMSLSGIAISNSNMSFKTTHSETGRHQMVLILIAVIPVVLVLSAAVGLVLRRSVMHTFCGLT